MNDIMNDSTPLIWSRGNRSTGEPVFPDVPPGIQAKLNSGLPTVRALGGSVTAMIGDDLVEVQNQEYDRILIRVEAIDAVAMS